MLRSRTIQHAMTGGRLSPDKAADEVEKPLYVVRTDTTNYQSMVGHGWQHTEITGFQLSARSVQDLESVSLRYMRESEEKTSRLGRGLKAGIVAATCSGCVAQGAGMLVGGVVGGLMGGSSGAVAGAHLCGDTSQIVVGAWAGLAVGFGAAARLQKTRSAPQLRPAGVLNRKINRGWEALKSGLVAATAPAIFAWAAGAFAGGMVGASMGGTQGALVGVDWGGNLGALAAGALVGTFVGWEQYKYWPAVLQQDALIDDIANCARGLLGEPETATKTSDQASCSVEGLDLPSLKDRCERAGGRAQLIFRDLEAAFGQKALEVV